MIEEKVREGMLEIRWHGRGGQGVVTAGKLLAAAALDAGLYFQAFPDYGPERMGAPIRAFTRLSLRPIYVHSQIVEPDVVAVLDPSLLELVDVTEGMGPEGMLLVNTTEAAEGVRERADWPSGRLFTVDASGIARRHLGRDVTNTPMLGALTAVLGLLSPGDFTAPLWHAFGEKFGEKSVRDNMAAMREAAETVREAAAGGGATGRRDGQTDGLKGWEALPVGGLILEAGNAMQYHTGSWRSSRPHLDLSSCSHCLFCWLYCPDGSIVVESGKVVQINYDYCKGCGICAAVCPREAILMAAEGEPAVEEVA